MHTHCPLTSLLSRDPRHLSRQCARLTVALKSLSLTHTHRESTHIYSESEDDEYASAEEEAAEALEGGEEVAGEGESELLVWSAGARCGAGWPRADARASGDG